MNPFLDKIKGVLTGSGSELIKSITGLVDVSKFSEEEKAAHALKVQELVLADRQTTLQEVTKQMQSEDKAISDRWTADMASDSWLSKNTRPIVMLSLLAFLFLMIILDSIPALNIVIDPAYIDLMKGLLLTVVVAYFGSRGVEKFKTIHESSTRKK